MATCRARKMETFTKRSGNNLQGEAKSAHNLEHSGSPWQFMLQVVVHLPAATVHAAISNMQHCGSLPSVDAPVQVETVLLSNARGTEVSTNKASFFSLLRSPMSNMECFNSTHICLRVSRVEIKNRFEN